MLNFEKDNVSLLKSLLDLVKDNIEFGSVNADIESDVGEFIADLHDRKRMRELKKLKIATDKWLKELEAETRLKKAEQKHNDEKLQESNRIRAERADEHQ